MQEVVKCRIDRCAMTEGRVLWWGRSDSHYSRNRIVRQGLAELGFSLYDFSPRLSLLGDVEAALRRLPPVQLVWVPCFRQRDIAAAARWARRHRVPLLVDPLISAYDKRIQEQAKFSSDSFMAKRLLHWERELYQGADLLLADTEEHANFFRTTFALPASKVAVVPVGAEEALFRPAANPAHQPLEVLFFGSFIALQGPQVIARAAALYRGRPLRWRFVGNGPLLAECRNLTAGLEQVRFDPWVSYERLASEIHRADIVLGIFGTSEKAGRVIPNKVYQALACGRPVITRDAPAYPAQLPPSDSGLIRIAPGDPEALAAALAELAEAPQRLAAMGAQARRSYEEFFSPSRIVELLGEALQRLGCRAG